MQPTFQPLRKTIWDYLFYASMAILTLWLILKSAGIIKTPFWLEYGVPIGTLILGFLTFYQSLNDKILTLSVSDARLEERLARLDDKFVHIDRDVESLKRALRVNTP